MTKVKLSILFIILLILTSCGNYCEDYLEDQEVSGIVTSKYKDWKSHNIKKLEITNENGIHILVIDDKKNIFWNFVEKGYFLSKEKGSTKITIVKNNMEYTFDLCNNQ
jgi:hypothetical protein